MRTNFHSPGRVSACWTSELNCSRLFRSRAARSGGSHVGLGLALVAAYAPIVGAEIHADLDAAGNLFRVNVQFAGQSDAAHASGPSGSFRMDVRTSRVAHMAARADL